MRMKDVGMVLLALVMGSSEAALSDSIYPRLVLFELSSSERAALDRLTCAPLDAKLRKSIGMDSDGSDRNEYSAFVRCAPHAKIYGHAVFFVSSCEYEGTWSCDAPIETLSVSYSDRRVHVTVEGSTLTEAFHVVSHLVLRSAIERADVQDMLDSQKTPPLDECHVRAVQENLFRVDCHRDERMVERFVSDGVTKYRQIPLPGCATTDNPACALYRMGYRSRMTGHGFRGVASTLLHEQGWPHEHIELQLAHQERNAVSASYNHAMYLEPRARMMQAWADHLDHLRQQGGAPSDRE